MDGLRRRAAVAAWRLGQLAGISCSAVGFCAITDLNSEKYSVATSNSPASNSASTLLGDVVGVGEAELLDALEVDAVDDLPAEVAAQAVGALAADADDLDRLAVAQQPLRVGARQPGDVGVEAAAQAALGRHDDQQMHLILAGADQQRRGAGLVGDALRRGWRARASMRSA